MDERFLLKIYRKLKREHRDLLGLGIGWRRKNNRLQKAPAIRLVVAKKCSPKSKSTRQFPKQIKCNLTRGKRPLSIKIFTDVEEMGEWVPTSFPLLINGTPQVVATCYVSWQSPNGASHIGVVTVAHPFQGPGQIVDVTVANGVIPGVVSLRSDLIADGLDVGLVELQPGADSLLPCLSSPMNPGAASVSATINMLGLSDADQFVASISSWFSPTPAQGRALSYYLSRTLQTPSGQSYELKSVILADGPPNTFGQGRSGSPWIVDSSEANLQAIALQSHGHAGLSFRLGLGTHIGTALRWLSTRPGIQNL